MVQLLITVAMADCSTATISYEGFVISEEYTFDGSTLNLVPPFLVNPPECSVTYSCETTDPSDSTSLCEINTATTTNSFSTSSGALSIYSTNPSDME